VCSSDLAQLPPSMQGQLSGSGARPWVRLKVTTGEPFFGEIDHGSAVGSFRLVPTPYPLDPPLPAPPTDRVLAGFPLVGTWYLGQGSHGTGTHAAIPWAYDLHQTDNALVPEDPPGSTDNADNFSYGAPIVARETGTVFSMKNDQVDQPAYTCCAPQPPNWMFLEIAGGIGLLFSHTRMGSIPFAPFDQVTAGSTVGLVGNSGSNSWAHLHYEAQAIDDGFASRPVAFRRVAVGLNPEPGDPWRRDFTVWDAREGFFVADLPAQVPLPAAWLLGATAVLLAGFGAAGLRRALR
ncbi:MAG: M23 family metallopeptidase, partial [Myxococcota bacterium]